MKAFNKIACSFLAIAVVMGLTACAAKTFDHQKLTGLCKSAKLEESSDFDEYYKTYRKVSAGSKKENGAYFTGTKSDAQNVYDNVLNLFEGLPSHDVEEATTFISLQVLCLLWNLPKRRKNSLKSIRQHISGMETTVKKRAMFILSHLVNPKAAEQI